MLHKVQGVITLDRIQHDLGVAHALSEGPAKHQAMAAFQSASGQPKPKVPPGKPKDNRINTATRVFAATVMAAISPTLPALETRRSRPVLV